MYFCNDLCLDSEIVASLSVRYAGGKNPFPLHSLVRPDGTTYTFFKDSNTVWQTTTRTPISLKKAGDNWQITTLGDTVETYNASGQLISMTNASGQTTKLDSAKGVDGTSHYAYDKIVD